MHGNGLVMEARDNDGNEDHRRLWSSLPVSFILIQSSQTLPSP
jgi:hypothetical protein